MAGKPALLAGQTVGLGGISESRFLETFHSYFLIGTGCLLPTFEFFRLSGINEVMTDLLQSQFDLRHHLANSDCREVATSSDCQGPSSVSGALKLCPCCEFDVMDKIGAWRNNQIGRAHV